jgi:orotidine-5'-phosphate decarboxylase
MSNPVFVAVDTPDVAAARALVAAVAPHVGGVKLGLEFFCAHGPAGIAAVMEGQSLPLFLDLKLHDIPNTVAGAVRSLAPLAPSILTIHAAGGHARVPRPQSKSLPFERTSAVPHCGLFHTARLCGASACC